MNKKKTHGDYKVSMKAMFKEYISSLDYGECKACIYEGNPDQELNSLIVEEGLNVMFEITGEKQINALISLLSRFLSDQLITQSDFLIGMKCISDMLDDLALDVPKAPEICGTLLGHAILNQFCTINHFKHLCENVEGAEAK